MGSNVIIQGISIQAFWKLPVLFLQLFCKFELTIKKLKKKKKLIFEIAFYSCVT